MAIFELHTARKFLINNLPAGWQPYVKKLGVIAIVTWGRILRFLGRFLPILNVPTHIHETFRDWATSQPSVSLLQIEGETTRDLTDIETRPKFSHPELSKIIKPTSQALYAAELSGMRIANKGSIIAPDNGLIGDLSHIISLPSDANPVFLSPVMPKLEKQSGRVACLATEDGNVFSHWVSDVLSRFHILEKSGLAFDKIYINADYDFQLECLEMLGFEKSQIIPARYGAHIQPDTLITVSQILDGGNPPLWMAGYHKKAFSAHLIRDRAQPSRIYISRNKSAGRNIINEDEVSTYLKSKGFQRIYMEELSFKEKINCAYNADIIVSPHGAAFSNLVFCREGTKVLEIFSPHYMQACYWSLAELMNLDYHHIVGDQTLPILTDDQQFGREDIFCPLDKLQEQIETLING